MNNRALVIDDDQATLDLMRFQLESEDFYVETAEKGELGIKLAEENSYDIILTDLNLPDINGIEMVKRFKQISPDTEIIMITGFGSVEKAVEATKAGAFYYVEKPVEFEELLVLIEKAIERKQQVAEIKELRGKLSNITSYQGIIGGSKSMQNIFEMIENVAHSDANILILGESGTGKEVIANAIHYKSQRAKKPFVKVNCSALPKDLIESQLFGHIKGSFTGANKDKNGFIGQAYGGSILLDEIGEMPQDLQPKLLRVLQEKVYYRVGSDRPREADFRLISSTNRDPFDAIKDGSLREDLYYRINTIEIKIPPLRERMDDVPMLAEHFLAVYAKKYDRNISKFSQRAYDQMLNYHWRGNVRELQHAIERGILLTKTETINNLNITSEPRAVSTAAAAATVDGNSLMQSSNTFNSISNNFPPQSNEINLEYDSEEDLFEHIGEIIVNNLPEDLDDDTNKKDKKDVFSSLEYGVVLAALKKTDGNKQAAANLLGLYRPRLYGMIKRHNIEKKLDN
ncbi:MAG: sigma-54-dependent transcriptional regulator [Aridibacter sp.]